MLAGYALSGAGTVRPGRSLLDGSAVSVELLEATGPELAARATALRAHWRRADGRHLVRVRDVVVLDDLVAVVRDAVDGPDLEQERVRAGGTLAPAAAAAVVADVLDALADLHAAGLVHGDVAAAAVRVDVSVPLRPAVRLTGWGSVALLGLPCSPADDVRAAGRLLRSLLTGSPEGALDPATAPALDPVLRALHLAEQPADRCRDDLRAAPLAGLPAQPPVVPVPFVPPADAATAGPLLRAPAPPAEPPRRRRLPRPAVLVPCLLVLLALVAVAVALPRDRDSTGATATPQPYAFPSLVRPDGLVLDREWTLEQDGTVLHGRTVVSNPTGSVRSAGVDEVVPKSVADDVDDLVFTPGPEAIVQRDPVVRFNVRDLQPGAERAWEFTVVLPEPADAAGLVRLADDAEQARLTYESERRRVLAELRASASPDPGQD